MLIQGLNPKDERSGFRTPRLLVAGREEVADGNGGFAVEPPEAP
jgi:hypothetical protein